MTLNPGDAAPDFDMPASGGRRVSLDGMKGKPFVPLFLPQGRYHRLHEGGLRLSGGIAATRRSWRGGHRRLEGPDETDRQFAAKYGLSFPLASDEGGDVIERYGCWAEKAMYGRKYMGTERTTFLIDAKGKIAQVWRKVSVPGHAAEVLRAAAALG